MPTLQHTHQRLAAAALLLSALVLFGLVQVRSLTPDLPDEERLYDPPLARSTIAYTADGRPLMHLYREYRVQVPYDSIAAPVIEALLAVEDRRFFSHDGVDVRRLAAAALHTLRGQKQGGSTITMQLARNLYPEVGRAPTLRRKAKEILTALRLERRHEKEELLELYLNAVSFGRRTFGIEAAARRYYGKQAAALNPAEAALLVGVLKGPSFYDPIRHPDRARRRRNVVLAQMARGGYLEEAALPALQQRPLGVQLRSLPPAVHAAPHFAAYLRRWLSRWAEENGYDLYRDGLRIHTTLDSRLQNLAEASVRHGADSLQAVAGYEWSRARSYFLSERPGPYVRAEADGRFEPFAHFWQTHSDLLAQSIRRTDRYRRAVRASADPDTVLHRLLQDTAFLDSLKKAKTRLEAGLVALEPATGRVKAWVGSRDFARDQYDKVSMARRQPGSVFKPFVYAAALEAGFAPYDRLRDSVRTYHFHGADWRPRNAGGASNQWVALREGMAHSKNTVTARLMSEVGPPAVVQVARRLGIRSPLDPVPALSLGTSPVTLLEMTAAYAALADAGRYREPAPVTHITDHRGRTIASFASPARRALSPYTAYALVDMMRDVIDQGTGRRINYQYGLDEYDLAGKTGTTQKSADGWFMLMHPQLVVGSWVGFNDQRVTFRSSFWGQGAHNALPLAASFVHSLSASPGAPLSAAPFTPPDGYRPYRPPPLPADNLPQSETYDAGGYQHVPQPVSLRPADTSATDAEAILRQRLDEP